jgi:hypothetical protein
MNAWLPAGGTLGNDGGVACVKELPVVAFVSCSFLMCFLRSKFLQKPFPQILHVNGFLSL